jgi:cyclic pyranopterin phosphate synthase
MLIDNFGRKIDYLRISVTDRCNLRCIYCMPETGILNKPRQDLLTFEEILRIVKAAVSLGINKIRLTGGEPLIRKDIVNLIKSLSEIQAIEDISLTTNGILLNKFAFELKKAGVKRLNISLDSLDEDRYKFITRLGNLKHVKEGITKSLIAGFFPIKVNVLLLEGINDSEIRDFLRLSRETFVHIRFLELMPIGNNDFYKQYNSISYDKIMKICCRFGSIEQINIYGSGPAKTFRFKDALGTFGFIAPISNKFCSSCNRLRLTSDGFLKGCLHSDLKINLRDSLRTGISETELIQLIKLAVYTKPKEHSLDKNELQFSEYLMCQIGG